MLNMHVCYEVRKSKEHEDFLRAACQSIRKRHCYSYEKYISNPPQLYGVAHSHHYVNKSMD